MCAPRAVEPLQRHGVAEKCAAGRASEGGRDQAPSQRTPRKILSSRVMSTILTSQTKRLFTAS